MAHGQRRGQLGHLDDLCRVLFIDLGRVGTCLTNGLGSFLRMGRIRDRICDPYEPALGFGFMGFFAAWLGTAGLLVRLDCMDA